MTFTSTLSFIAVVFSAIALFITYRKDAHQIRLEVSLTAYRDVILGIVNDGGVDTSIRSIGYFYRFGEVTWLTKTVGNHRANVGIEFPLAVKARSTFEVFLNTSQKIPQYKNTYGFCVQLDTGRLFIYSRHIAKFDAIRMHIVSWISCITGGRYSPGIQRPRFKVY
jgi:hypothetical protein